jgi:hypothetical protein
MYKVKDSIKGKNAVSGVNDKQRALKGLSSVINLDLASQKELRYLYENGNPYIEKVSKTKKDKGE